MQKITINRPVLMQAIIGLNPKKVKTACLLASQKKIVSLASINSDNQIIISGDESAVRQASIYCKKFGAKHILNINTNIPAHCKLLKPISKKIKKALNMINIYQPTIPVINNVDVKYEDNSKNIKNALIRQIYNTVRWKEIMELIELKKIFVIVEIGPNKILTNLKKNNTNITSFNTDTLKNFLIAFSTIHKK